MKYLNSLINIISQITIPILQHILKDIIQAGKWNPKNSTINLNNKDTLKGKIDLFCKRKSLFLKIC